MKNKPWKTWKTRKVTFIAVCILWLVMAVLGLCGREIDPTIIDFIFGAGKWLLTFGIVLVISDKTGDMLLKRNGGNGDEL